MKVLNLYAGIGGNRKLWEDVEVVAIENNPKIAEIYQDFFPGDKVIACDAHQYLLDHFEEFDFIWSSPPCPTHSKVNTFLHAKGVRQYSDMRLYQEIIFLKLFFKGYYCVENVVSYYKPLIKPVLIGKHYFWANFNIKMIKHKKRPIKDDLKGLEKYHGFSINCKNKRLLLRNCVYPPLGLHILNESKIDIQPELFRPTTTMKGG